MAAHTEPAYAEHPRRPLPVTERLTAGSLILPLFHQMTEAEQDQVVSVIHAAAGVATPAGRA
jgi:perosamine synthetase